MPGADPAWREVLVWLGDERLPAVSQAVAVITGADPGAAAAIFAEALSRHRQGALRQALALYDGLLDSSLAVPALVNRAAALKALSYVEPALQSLTRAVRLAPMAVEAHAGLAALLQETDQSALAILFARRALALDPAASAAWTTLGLAWQDHGDHQARLTSLSRAVRLNGERPLAHMNHAFALLTFGAYAEGWREHEWRWRVDQLRLSPPPTWGPMWRGEPLAGKTLLVVEEGGFGDTLQFVRFLADLKRHPIGRGARIVLRCRPQLVRLLRKSEGIDEVVATDVPLPPVDCFLPLMSMMDRLGVTLADLPGAVPYLHPDPTDIDRWGGALASNGADGALLKVGLVWSGGLNATDPLIRRYDERRSVPLAQLAPLAAVPGVRWYSMQVGAGAAQIAEAGEAFAFATPMRGVSDFADTAAIMTHLDLLIGVDTAPIHVAGGVGRPVWCLSRFSGCWRWLLDRDDSPWYPTLRLFRQPAPGAWGPVVDQVARALRIAVDARSRP